MPPSQKILLSHPTGNANVREVLKMLDEHALLEKFVTSIAWERQALKDRLLPSVLTEQLRRREFSIQSSAVCTKPFPEYMRLAGERYSLPILSKYFNINRVYQGIDQLAETSLDRLQAGAVYCYEDGALRTFRRAKTMGLKCYYDLPIAYWETAKSLMAEEAERLPQWAKTIQGAKDSPEKLTRKTEEAELADVIITPSQFVYNSLPKKIREEKECAVIPFGTTASPHIKSRKTPENGPIRVLFAGSLTQRKGLADLFQAMQLIGSKEVELVVMGSLCAPLEFYQEECAEFIYEPPRPHHKVLQLMSECDLFVLPSLVEGRALVQLEALSVGLPLIISRHTGGEDLISKKAPTGFQVDVRSPDQIAERIEWFIDNRGAIDAMKENCRQHARTITWEKYRASLHELVSKSDQ